MTPEEKAVIEAAITFTHEVDAGNAFRDVFKLTDAVRALLDSREAYESVKPMWPDLEFPNAGWPADWRPATFLYCLAGDRIRIGQDESDVLRSSSGAWHANVVSSVMPSGKTWDKVTPWKHTELRLDLSANPGFREYPPNTPCEILCTPERLAILTLMQAFPGSEKIS